MQFLLLRLYGPLVAWGDIAIGERRPSYSRPSKSAVLGLLAGALGYRREEVAKHDALRDGLGFATRVDAPGDLLEDFHTTEVPAGPSVRQFQKQHGFAPATRRHELQAMREKDNPTLSYREYRMDALSIACLWRTTEGGPSLETLAGALRRPVFAPYLGRKSCVPGLPFAPKIVDASGPVEALVDAAFPGDDLLAPVVGERGERTVHIAVEGAVDTGSQAYTSVRRRDVPYDRTRWQFLERVEHQLTVRIASEGGAKP